jgi:N-acetylneuraminate synthase/N,N'-diacetyllegionaminate synthase
VKHVLIDDRPVGPDQPVFIVVETGTTCNGDLETALRLVDAARDAHADAVKFQLIGPEYFMSDTTVTYEYEWAGGRRSENMFDMFKSLQFGPEQWERIRDRCVANGLAFYATVDYVPGIELAERLAVAAYKLSSWDLGNVPLIRAMARTGKPIQIDLGPARLAEIEKAIDLIVAEGNEQIVLVHCSHSKTDDGINVRSVPYLGSVFGRPTGYSCDSRDHVPDLAAVALGARLLEKRVTLDRNYEGHHHLKALEPDEFADWVQMVRRAEAVLGEFAVRPSEEDLRQKEQFFVSLTADVDIAAGETITAGKLACKRPGTGIAPEHVELLVGRTARRPIRRNELLTWDVV